MTFSLEITTQAPKMKFADCTLSFIYMYTLIRPPKITVPIPDP